MIDINNVQAKSKAVGTYKPYFMNGAGPDQDVFGSYKNYEKFAALQKQLVSNGFFTKRAGGYKRFVPTCRSIWVTTWSPIFWVNAGMIEVGTLVGDRSYFGRSLFRRLSTYLRLHFSCPPSYTVTSTSSSRCRLRRVPDCLSFIGQKGG